MAAVEAEQDKGMEVVAMIRELSIYEAMGGTYTEVDGVLYPNIVISEESDVWVIIDKKDVQGFEEPLIRKLEICGFKIKND